MFIINHRRHTLFSVVRVCFCVSVFVFVFVYTVGGLQLHHLSETMFLLLFSFFVCFKYIGSSIFCGCSFLIIWKLFLLCSFSRFFIFVTSAPAKNSATFNVTARVLALLGLYFALVSDCISRGAIPRLDWGRSIPLATVGEFVV